MALALLTACGASPQHTAGPPPLQVGATSDTESIVLANLYAAALRYYGSPADVQVVADPMAGLDAGTLDVAPGFTGRLLHTFDPAATSTSDEQVYKDMVGALPEGVAAGDYATAAEDKPAVTVSEKTATVWGGTDLTDLVRHCRDVRAGAVRGTVTPAKVGTCTLPRPREYPDAATLFAALKAGEINAAWATTAQPDVPGDVVMLADAKPKLIPAENAVPLYRRNELAQQQVLAVNQIAGVLDTAALKALRTQVDGGTDPRTAAQGWLADNPLGH